MTSGGGCGGGGGSPRRREVERIRALTDRERGDKPRPRGLVEPSAITFAESDEALVRSIATRLRIQLELRSDLDDLISAGYLGLVEARSRFDASRGIQFSTFAYYRIRGAMVDHLRKSTTLSRRAYAKVKLAESADRVGEDVAELRAAAPAERANLEATVQALDDAVGKLTASFVLSCLGLDEEPTDPETALADSQQAGRLHAAIESLPERERAIVVGHYIDGRRFDAIAEELGVSKSWTSRMHGKALQRIRRALES